MVVRFLIDAVAARADVQLAKVVPAADDIADVVAREGADVVMLGTDKGVLRADQLVHTSQAAVLVAVSISGERACIYTRRGRPQYIAARTAPELLEDAMRALSHRDV
jgi:hypothetical protein